MNILFTLCARSGSKGYKNKNFKKFLDYPIYLYSLSLIDLFMKKHPDLMIQTVINSDNLVFKNDLLNNLKMNYIFLERSQSLSGDTIAKLDVIKNSYLSLKNHEIDYDLVIDLDITSPLRRLTDLENVYSKSINNQAELIYTVVESRRSPYFNMVQKKHNFYERVISSSFNTRQAVPSTYDMNASIYAYKSFALIEHNHINEFNSDVIHMEENYVLDIDSERDFTYMEVIANYLFKTETDYNLIRKNIDNITLN